MIEKILISICITITVIFLIMFIVYMGFRALELLNQLIDVCNKKECNKKECNKKDE